jgi:hypothetical protein
MQHQLPLGWLFLAATITLSVTSHADVYRWKDDRGYVHFSTKPPQGIDAKKITGGRPASIKPSQPKAVKTLAKRASNRGGRPPVKQQPDLDTLLEIVLPANATRREARDYIQKILLASRNQRTYLASDPQVGMLIEVGPDNVDVLIDVAQDANPWSRYVVEALSRLAGDKDKQDILQALPGQRYLATVVLRKRWCRDAKPYLLDGMEGYAGYLPGDWIECVARLKDPSTYPQLKFYLENGWNRHTTYRAIKHLPGIELERSLQQGWDNAQTKGNRYEVAYLAADTVRTGYLPAMDYVVDNLTGGGSENKIFRNARAIALRHLNYFGSDAEIRKWYTKNRRRLVYNRNTKRFELP